jgi:biopolymer transport protein ExbD
MAVNIKKPPTLNAMQTADMAFIMLCFFMMVTTMGSEFGLIRQLPPWVEHNPNDKGDKVNERNVLVVRINSQNSLLVNGQYMEMSQLRAKTKEFFDINNVGDNFPEKITEEFPYLGTININRTALVSLQNDRGTAYRTYIIAQNELTAAINELRDEFCLQRFASRYENCNSDQQDIVGNQIYKMSISEAEPRGAK